MSAPPSRMRIDEVQSTFRLERVATHTHVKGLGLNPDGTSKREGDGLVGQCQAREVVIAFLILLLMLLFIFFLEAVGIMVDMIKAKKMAGKAVLFCGPPGTGKVSSLKKTTIVA